MNAEGRFEVSRFVKVMFEAFAQRVAVGTNEIGFHFRFAYHSVPEHYRPQYYE